MRNCGWADLQDTQAKYSYNTCFLLATHSQAPHKRYRETEDPNIQENVCDAAANIHDWVIRGRYTCNPVARDRPDLEESREQKGDQPSNGESDEDLDCGWKLACAEDSRVEKEHGKLDESDGDDVPELQREQYLDHRLSGKDISISIRLNRYLEESDGLFSVE